MPLTPSTPTTNLNTTATDTEDRQAKVLNPLIVEVDNSDAFIDNFVDKEPDANTLADLVFSKDTVLNNSLLKALAILHDQQPLAGDVIGKAQTLFYHCLVKGIIDKDETEASNFLTTILEFIEDNLERMFSPRKIFRSVNQMPSLSLSQHVEFEVLLRILVDTAILETRITNARSMNWVQIEANISTPHKGTLLERLQNFYHI